MSDHIETQAIHAGEMPPSDAGAGAIVPPLHLTTTFERGIDGDYAYGHRYSRESTPNRLALERSLAALEGGVDALAFASGSVATMTLLQALQPGDHIIAPADFYYGIRQLIKEVFIPWGLQVAFVDMNDLNAVRDALHDNTRLVLLETPSNPLLQVADIAAIADIVHRGGALLAVDNTIATPVLQKPFELGADIIMHATTKYLSGHSDVLGGALIAREETPLFERVKRLQSLGGAVAAPFDCWLALRGVQTLPYRVRAISQNAMTIAQFLDDHPAIERVLYPGLPSHPSYAIAHKQMSQYGGLMSVLVRGAQPEAMRFVANVRLFARATSFGGTHSLIEHRASMETQPTPTPNNLVRLAIGLEQVDDLIADLQQALTGI